MTTVNQARWIHRFKLVRNLVIAVIVIAIILFLTGPRFGSIYQALSPPHLRQVDISKEVEWLSWQSQNWSPEQTQIYHHISQGTMTVPVPIGWFKALEQANPSPLSILWGRQGLFSDPQYMANLGFIPGMKSKHNPYNLPVGFATTDYVHLPGLVEKQTGMGFNCAACHTGQFVYGDKRYVVEGGPANANFGHLTSALGAALGQTALSNKIPIFNGRFERFARGVLGDEYSDANKLELGKQLDAVIAALGKIQNAEKVAEGAGRLDALNRIGNQVFATNVNRPENYVPVDAPVNFPHIWTTSWFDWVQYDGSIMQPLVRNAGEAMGVLANINTTAPLDQNRFASSIPLDNLRWIEEQLSGNEPPAKNKWFGGLWQPKWPDSLPAIKPEMAVEGRKLYNQHCQHCHLPTMDSDEFWSYMKTVKWWEGDQLLSTPDKLINVKLIPISQVGTDPAQANILQTRTVNTSNTLAENTTMDNSLGINATVCAPNPVLKLAKTDTFLPATIQPWTRIAPDDLTATGELKSESLFGKPQTQRLGLVEVPVGDGPRTSFALALGAMVQQVNDQWFAQNYIDKIDQQYFTEGRPNCLRAAHAYKARPLNGVWATAPFLHNGSVPTLHDMLIPAKDRPKFVQLGNDEFDAEHVGVKQLSGIKMKHGRLYDKGLFILDTSIPGNLNTGHEFSSEWQPDKGYMEQKQGVIGPELSEVERMQIIEFLKTI